MGNFKKQNVLMITFLAFFVLICFVKLAYAQTAEEYNKKGIEYGALGDFKKAEENFNKAVKVDSSYKFGLEVIKNINDNAIKKETAVCLFKGKEYELNNEQDKAVIEYKKAMDLEPNSIMAYFALASIYYRKGMLDDAFAQYEKIVSIDSKNIDVHLGLGTVYMKKGMMDNAVVEYKEVLSVNSNYAEAHYGLGTAYSHQGKLNDAVVELKKAIDINPSYAEAYNNLAVVYYNKKEYELAIESCDKAVQLGAKVHPGFLEALKPYRK